MTTVSLFHRHSYDCGSPEGLCPTRQLRKFRSRLGDVAGDLAVLPEDLRDLLVGALQEVCDAFIDGLVVERWPDVDAADRLDDVDTAFVVEELDEVLSQFQDHVIANALRRLDRLVERSAGKSA